MQFGISTHLYHSHVLAEEHLREVAAHGFDCVELFAARGHFDYHDPQAIADLGRWLQSAGMHLHSVHAPIVESISGHRWGAAYSNATLDQEARRQAVHEARAALEIARAVPYRYLIIHLGLAQQQNPGPDDNVREQAKRSVQELHDAADGTGVSLALEVIPNHLATAESLVRMIEDELDLPDIGICLDFGHAFIMGDLVDTIETASGQILTTHVHDNLGKTDDHLAPFDGKIDWTAAMMVIQKIGYEGTLLFELQSREPARTVLERAASARRRLEQLLDGEWAADMSTRRDN
jgi:sugar phosphate isomerase/epimerase